MSLDINEYNLLAALKRSKFVPETLGRPSGQRELRSGGGPLIFLLSLLKRALDAVPQGIPKCTHKQFPDAAH
jgi:hypothetical protein